MGVFLEKKKKRLCYLLFIVFAHDQWVTVIGPIMMIGENMHHRYWE